MGALLSFLVAIAILAGGIATVALVYYVFFRLRFGPTRRLALVVLALSPLWLLSATPSGRTIAGVAVLLLLLVAVIDGIRIAGTDDIEVEREVPATLGLGDEPSPAAYRVRSRWPGTLRGTRVDALPPAVERATGPAESHHLSLGGEPPP